MQTKTADATEQIPHVIHRQLSYPVTRRGIQLACHRRVGLEETVRADPQRHVVKPLRQRLLFSQEDFCLPFHNRHMHRLKIDADDLQLRQLRLQPRQRSTQLCQFAVGTQNKAQHHTAIKLTFRQQKVLKLSTLARHVVGSKSGTRYKRFQHGKHRRKRGRIERTIAQILWRTIAMQHAQQRFFHTAADHHLRFIAKRLLRAADRRAPLPDRKTGKQILQIGGFGGELLANGLRDPLTGTTATGVIECALHTETFI